MASGTRGSVKNSSGLTCSKYADSAGVRLFGIDAKLASAASPCDIGFISPVVFAEPRAASACGIPKRARAPALAGNIPGTKAAAMGSKGAISLGTILSATLLATLLTLFNIFLNGIYSPESDPIGGISITFTNTSWALVSDQGWPQSLQVPVACSSESTSFPQFLQ